MRGYKEDHKVWPEVGRKLSDNDITTKNRTTLHKSNVFSSAYVERCQDPRRNFASVLTETGRLTTGHDNGMNELNGSRTRITLAIEAFPKAFRKKMVSVPAHCRGLHHRVAPAGSPVMSADAVRRTGFHIEGAKEVASSPCCSPRRNGISRLFMLA